MLQSADICWFAQPENKRPKKYYSVIGSQGFLFVLLEIVNNKNYFFYISFQRNFKEDQSNKILIQ